MIYIPNLSHNPSINLATEEYILTASGLTEPVLFFYINESSVIIGRHQNTMDEINEAYVKEHGIQVVRRLSGGGAVYHDLGNLNYSFIFPGETAAPNFAIFTAPIIHILRALGAPVELSGRNDLLIDGMKVSGNAFYRNASGSVCHGTLMFDTDLSILSKALQTRPEKFQHNGVSSVRSRVTNLKSYLPGILSAEMLRERILSSAEKESGLIRSIILTETDKKKIQNLVDQKYGTKLWNYGKSPMYNIRVQIRKDIGWIEICAEVKDHIIVELHFFGDFFSIRNPDKLAEALRGTNWSEKSLIATAEVIHWSEFFPEFSVEEFVHEMDRQGAFTI